jgi:hypothetical protein
MFVQAHIRLSAAVLAILAVAGCNAPPKLILPGKLDLPVASGDQLKLCSDDGLEDTTPNADCVLSSAEDPTEPYMKSLEKMGWTPAAEADQQLLLRWISPEKAGAARTCLIMMPQITNAARREGALLEFTLRPMGPGTNLACEPVQEPS